eukprot:m.24541 g.24541  ORF g.24541 m.24541 type:complete len:276 (+) comp11274_c0_seq1:152-979(+)
MWGGGMSIRRCLLLQGQRGGSAWGVHQTGVINPCRDETRHHLSLPSVKSAVRGMATTPPFSSSLEGWSKPKSALPHLHHHCHRRGLASVSKKPWLEDRANRPDVSRSELNVVLNGNISRTVDWVKEEDFMTVLRHSSFASTGPTHHGQHFEALVLSKDDKGVHVDYGGKFDARIRMSSRNPDLGELVKGSRIVIDLQTPEATAHLLGDAKHVSIHRAVGHYVSTISTPTREVKQASIRSTPADDMSSTFSTLADELDEVSTGSSPTAAEDKRNDL